MNPLTLYFALLLAPFASKADMSLKFKDISIKQTLWLVKTMGVPTDSFPKLEGKIGNLRVGLYGDIILGRVDAVQTQQDSTKEEVIRWATVIYNRKTGWFEVRSEALGGLIELQGVLPNEKSGPQSPLPNRK